MNPLLKRLLWLDLLGIADLLGGFFLSQALYSPVPLLLSFLWSGGCCCLGFLIGNKLVFREWEHSRNRPFYAAGLRTHAHEWLFLWICLHLAVSSVICLLLCRTGIFGGLLLPALKIGLSFLCIKEAKVQANN